jgi:hypothetical protein
MDDPPIVDRKHQVADRSAANAVDVNRTALRLASQLSPHRQAVGTGSGYLLRDDPGSLSSHSPEAFSRYVQLSANHVDLYTREGRSFGAAIRGLFRVPNRTTGEETPFMVSYGVEGDLKGVPLLISWRPRWWLEIEFALRND